MRMTMTTAPSLPRRHWWSWSLRAFFWKALLLFGEREGVVGPSDARVVVGTLAIVVHLHEAGLGLLVDLCPTDPSLANLAIDRQALLLTSFPRLGK